MLNCKYEYCRKNIQLINFISNTILFTYYYMIMHLINQYFSIPHKESDIRLLGDKLTNN